MTDLQSTKLSYSSDTNTIYTTANVTEGFNATICLLVDNSVSTVSIKEIDINQASKCSSNIELTMTQQRQVRDIQSTNFVFEIFSTLANGTLNRIEIEDNLNWPTQPSC